MYALTEIVEILDTEIEQETKLELVYNADHCVECVEAVRSLGCHRAEMIFNNWDY